MIPVSLDLSLFSLLCEFPTYLWDPNVCPKSPQIENPQTGQKTAKIQDYTDMLHQVDLFTSTHEG